MDNSQRISKIQDTIDDIFHDTEDSVQGKLDAFEEVTEKLDSLWDDLKHEADRPNWVRNTALELCWFLTPDAERKNLIDLAESIAANNEEADGDYTGEMTPREAAQEEISSAQ